MVIVIRPSIGKIYKGWMAIKLLWSEALPIVYIKIHLRKLLTRLSIWYCTRPIVNDPGAKLTGALFVNLWLAMLDFRVNLETTERLVAFSFVQFILLGSTFTLFLLRQGHATPFPHGRKRWRLENHSGAQTARFYSAVLSAACTAN